MRIAESKITDGAIRHEQKSYPQCAREDLLVEPVDPLPEHLEEPEHALPVPQAGMALEVLLDKLPQRLGLMGLEYDPGQEAMKPDLPLQVLKVGPLVQRDVRHVAEEAS